MKTINQYEYINSNNASTVCNHCKRLILKPDNVWFDEKGTGYSTLLGQCPHCKGIVVLKYIEDISLDVNNDKRFYI